MVAKIWKKHGALEYHADKKVPNDSRMGEIVCPLMDRKKKWYLTLVEWAAEDSNFRYDSPQNNQNT